MYYKENLAYARQRLCNTVVIDEKYGAGFLFDITTVSNIRSRKWDFNLTYSKMNERVAEEIRDQRLYDKKAIMMIPRSEVCFFSDGLLSFSWENFFSKDHEDSYFLTPIERLKLSGYRLGYGNKENRSIYAERRPMRNDWRQGLRGRNTEAKFSEGRTQLEHIKYRDIISILNGQEYPTVEDVLKHNKGAAVHRDWYIGAVNEYEGSRVVMCNDQPVGRWMVDGGLEFDPVYLPLSDKFNRDVKQ